MHFNHILIENFKSLYKVEFNPKKITILIGQNASGKSSILQLLSILRQSIGSASGGYFRPSGEIIDLGSFSDIVFNHDESRSIRTLVEGRIFLGQEFSQVFGQAVADVSYRFDVGKNGVQSVYCKLKQGVLDLEMSTSNGDLRIGRFNIAQGNGKLKLVNSMNLLQGVSVSEIPGNSDKERDCINQLFQNSELIKQLFSNYYYIPPSRLMDEYGLPLVNSPDHEFVTSKGQRTTLSRLVSYLSSSTPQVGEMISDWTKRLFEKRIRTKNVIKYENQNEVKNVTIEFLEEGGKYNSITNDGSGTNQVILLLTLLGITPPHSILGIEEPEIHLHPKAQAELAKILIDVSLNAEKQIIFTTHSEHMLYPFLTSIASKDENSLSKDDVSILYFEKDEKTKITKITPLEVDENGMISGGLKGFFEAEISSLRDYLKALEK